MILILSNKWDLTVDFVLAELRARNKHFIRLNTEDLASGQAIVQLPEFQIRVLKNGHIINIADSLNVIWNRRPGKPYDNVPLTQRPSRAVQAFVNDQWYSWLEALQLVPETVWVNHPSTNDAMESKVRQLFLASKLGFRIPETLITNDADAARALANKYGERLVAKALFSPLIEEPEEDFFIYTTEISVTEICDDNEIRLSPLIFQKALRPKVDYRVTVVGDKVFPVKIENSKQGFSNIDWRMEKEDLEFLPCTLPPEIVDLCKRYVRENGLLFGAIDLVEHNEEFFFLEINPNGEWGWLQKPHNVPIAQALCDLLLYHDGTET